jgi:membrane associated rhomboid family serine protease
MPRIGQLGFPPFTKAVKQLVWANVAVFLLMLVLERTEPLLHARLVVDFGLVPTLVAQKFYLWQLITYSFLHAGIGHIFFNLLTLWMFGSQIETDWGSRKFYEYYFFCVIGAALVTLGVSFTHALGMNPDSPTVGASGGLYGLLVAYGILYAEQRVYIYGIFAIKAKILVAVWLAIALLNALSAQGGVNNVAHLGGAVFGYLYLKMVPRRGMEFAFSEGFYGLRNRYHRWKRKQAAKKFEVYMREHDRSQYFDEHGNFRDPDTGEKGNGESEGGKWVN